MNIREQILTAHGAVARWARHNRQIIVAPLQDWTSPVARDLASVGQLIGLKKDRLKNRGSPI